MANSEPKVNDEWRAEADLRTLIESRKIEGDPKRMKAAIKLAQEKRDAMSDIVDESEEEETEKG